MRIYTRAQNTDTNLENLSTTVDKSVDALNTTISNLNVVIQSLTILLDALKGTQENVFSSQDGVTIKNIGTIDGLYVLSEQTKQLSIKADDTYEFIHSSNSIFVQANGLLLIYTTFESSPLEENGWYVFKYTSNSSDVSDFLLDLSSKILISVESDTRVYNTFPKSISVTYV